MSFEIYPFIVGAILGMVLDILWFKSSVQKIEKGFEVLEHYHFGLILIAVGMLIPNPLSSFCFGLGFIFIVAEWRQFIEIKRGRVIPGHPFAYGSTHFRSSTIIGIILTGLTVLFFFVF